MSATRLCLAAVGLATLFASSALTAAPSREKLAAGAKLFDRSALPAPAPASVGSKVADYPLQLRVLEEDGTPAQAQRVSGPDAQVSLQLELTNLGAARQFKVATLTSAVRVTVARAIEVMPGQTIRVPVHLVRRECTSGPGFVSFMVRSSEPARGVRPASAKIAVSCR
jgi:hypothetical protein